MRNAVALAVLAFVSASIVAAEVLVTRLLSVTTWYGLAAVVLSLAMLGLTSGSIQAMRANDAGEPLAPWISRRLGLFSAGLLLAALTVLNVPLTFALDLTSFGATLLVAVAVSVPMIFGGAVVARLMAESAVSVPTLYAVDLVAAAGGALLPLVLIGPLSPQSALVLLAAVAALVALAIAPAGDRWARATLAFAMFATLFVSRSPTHGLELHSSKGSARVPAAQRVFQEWNALGQVELGPFASHPVPALWSPSPRTPHIAYVAANAQVDGEAATPVYAFENVAQLNVLRFDATTSAHALRPNGTACVIGVGGGRDLESALIYGHDRVIGVEINPGMIRMLRRVAAQSPILNDPRVQVIEGDGRAVYSELREQCRVLQASLVDTWAATGAGAFAHTESTLYTREAWAIFLRRVEPDGILTFSRWYDPTRVSETSRLVSLAMASLVDRGVAQPRRHIALIAAANVATILVSPEPLSDTDIERIRELELRMEFRILASPERRAADPLLERLLRAHSIDALTEAGRDFHFDTTPTSDDRPFFFQLMPASAWLHPIATVRRAMGSGGVVVGNATAMFELLSTFLAALIVAGFLLGPTLARAARAKNPPLPGVAATAYFGALGMGFMLVEIALVQRMHVVLGHPTYALIVVLASLLVATGVGSALSPRILRSRRAVTIAGLVIALLLAALPYVIRPLAHATLHRGLGARVVWTFALSALVGLHLGMMFPAGVRYVSRTRGAPVALAVNGATSVLGGTLAIIVSVWFGIPASFTLAAAIYAFAALVGPMRWRPLDDR